MHVLLTGAFGNIGQRTLALLLERGHQVRCFDVRTKTNLKAARAYQDRAEMIWGDLRSPEDVARAVQGVDAVIHLAFVIPKLSATGINSEDDPERAHAINVGGTRSLIAAMQAQPDPPCLLFTSSVHVYGRTQHMPPPRTLDDPPQPIEHYAKHKVECEQMVRASGLSWCIYRLGASMPARLILDPGMFEVRLADRIEYVHSRDVALAIANGLEDGAIWGRTWLIGGGPRCQLTYREVVSRVMGAAGVGMLPDEAFTSIPFPVDWLDTTESQRVLRFQTRTLDHYAADVQHSMGALRPLVAALRPFVRRLLLSYSAPYREARMRRAAPGWRGRVAVVTGASSGIGEATARRLASQGLTVVLVARRDEALQQIAAEIRAAGGAAHVVTADLADEADCQRMVDEVRASFGTIDVLVNNAGLAWYGYGSEMSWSLARQMIDVNTRAVVQLTLRLLGEMKERNSGHIINIGSVVGSLPSQGVALYGATKSFLDAFTSALYRELRGTNVHVSVVRPGAVNTPLFELPHAVASGHEMPVKHFGVRPERVADRVWRLLRRPARVAYVPRILSFMPWIEPMFGWLIDRLGPLLLKRRQRGVG